MYTFQSAMSAVTVTKENHGIIGMWSVKILSYVSSFLRLRLMFLAFQLSISMYSFSHFLVLSCFSLS